MSILSSLQDPILPIFMALLAGFFMRRVKFFDALGAQGINRFVFYVAMPALLFDLVRKVALDQIDWPTVNVYLFTEFVVYVGVALITFRVFKRSVGESILIGMAAGFVNHLMFVLPIARFLYGVQAAEPIAAIVFVDVIVFCFTVFLMDFIRAHESKQIGSFSVLNVAGMLSKNPMVIATVLGVIAGAFPSYLPSGVYTYSNFLAASAAPAALFALGVILGGQPIRPVGGPAWLAIGSKLVIHPALFFFISGVGGALVMKPDWQTMAFLVAAGPCGAMPFVIALQYNIKPEVIAKAVLISTVLSLVSLSVLTAA
jgi:malonate transporter